jgi:hypothetical protein
LQVLLHLRCSDHLHGFGDFSNRVNRFHSDSQLLLWQGEISLMDGSKLQECRLWALLQKWLLDHLL